MTTTPPAPFTLPAPVGALLSRLPAYPGSMLLVTLQIERWADCQAGCGELVMHLAPTE